jgi:nucleotide-binding universal stress UspA family protein
MSKQRKSLDEELRIVHATDLHPDGGIAFAHSVALASRGRGALFSLHANPADQDAVRRMPEASELLDEWKARGAADVSPTEFHRMSHTCCDDPVDTLLDAMQDIAPNLLVVGKNPTEGMFKFLHNSVSESLALNAQIPTLFLPIGGKGFVAQDTGDLQLERVLVPVEDEHNMLPVYEVLEHLLERLDVDDVEIILLHVGDHDDTLDTILTPEGRPGWKVSREERSGKLAEAIARCASEKDVDLVAMGTRGQDSLVDIFRGSNSQQVVRDATCPVLWVPLNAEQVPSGRTKTPHH